MACSTDFKKLHDLYQSEGVPKVIPVESVSRDGLLEPSSPEVVLVSALASDPLILNLDIRFSNGLHIHHEHIDYRSLYSLVEKLEALC